MELQSYGGAELKCLIGDGIGFREPDGPRGQVKCFSVPMQRSEGLRKQCSRAACRNPAHGEPTDFFFAAPVHGRAHRAGYHLRTKADAEDRASGFDCVPYQYFFFFQPWVKMFVIYAHGAAQDDEKIEVRKVWQGFAFIQT